MTRGFTLVETLVVLVIIGLVTGVAVLTLPGKEASLRDDALRLAARATLAAQDSIFSGAPTGLHVTGAGYSFYRMKAGTWQEVADDRVFSPVIWREGVAAALSREGGARITSKMLIVTTPEVVFDPTGLATRFTLTLAENGERFVVDGSATGRMVVERPR